jgi:3-(3-hydroxy-phenyl)propionate hydroxylase
MSTIGACTKEAAHHALAERYLGDAQQAVYLIRPDQHVVARWPEYDETAVKDAIKTALGENL